MFAAQAAVALGHLQQVEHLNEALQTRQQIGTAVGTAVGIVMERYKLDPQGAFAFLARLSSHANVKLREVAAGIVEDATERRNRQ